MSFLTNVNFTDPQGVTHPAATFGVAYATCSASEYTNLRRDMTDMTTMDEVATVNKNLNVQFYYWASETKRTEGKSPYILANMNDGTQAPTMSFDFVATDVEYAGMTVEAICLHYLQNTILAV